MQINPIRGTINRPGIGVRNDTRNVAGLLMALLLTEALELKP
jgi:hypothetical protein